MDVSSSPTPFSNQRLKSANFMSRVRQTGPDKGSKAQALSRGDDAKKDPERKGASARGECGGRMLGE